jgi:hypothetical protein
VSLRRLFYLIVILWFTTFFLGCCGFTDKKTCVFLAPMAAEAPGGNKIDKGGVVEVFINF